MSRRISMANKNIFSEVKKNFGFGCMRLPMKDGDVDFEQFSQMIDMFISDGFNYFDTAHGYIGGKSEIAIKKCLTDRYPRDAYLLTDKLTSNYFETEADIRPFFESQLKICGVDYFDFYLMHAQNADVFKHFKACSAYETAFELKSEGKIRHVGLSFHDRAEVLDRILTEYPQIEAVQIQLNYADYDDPAVQGRLCLEVCEKHNKPVIVMEPVKGGNLVNLPLEAKKVFDKLEGGSYASYAVRFAAGFDSVFMVLSGMSDIPQMADNLSYMKDFKPLDESECEAVTKVVKIISNKNLIPCTACRYCIDGCPKNISIPDLFACMNAKELYNDWNADIYYSTVYTANGGRASDCIGCGRCERICPQHLPIRALLVKTAEKFESGEHKYTDLDKAKKLLDGHTIVLCRGDQTIVSDKRGVSPMIDLIKDGRDVCGWSVADVVVGKAAAMLFVKTKMTAVYAKTISKDALAYLEAHGIPCAYSDLTDQINNRDGNGRCPMETAVLTIDDPETGYLAILDKIKELRQ